MDTVVNILVFIIIFCLVVISHEFGHFLIAKLNGIAVQEFTIGLGPKLFGFHKNGTYYVIRLLPFGGACIFEGDDVTPEDHIMEKASKLSSGEDIISESDKSSLAEPKKEEPKKTADKDREAFEKQKLMFNEANVFVRIGSVVAGPLFNFLLGLIMAIIIVHFCGETIPLIAEIESSSPAYEAGLREGDLITAINGEHVNILSEVTLINLMHPGETLEITYKRGGEKYETTVVPYYNEEYGRYLIGFTGSTVEGTMLNSVKYGFCEVRYWMVYSVKSLSMLVTGKLSKDDVSGPVGMVSAVGEVIEDTKPYGISTTILSLLNFATLISVNLGIINLLPLPALDGGRLLFLIFEAVRGKPVDRKKEAIVHFIGFILLLLLMIFVFFNDIMRLFK